MLIRRGKGDLPKIYRPFTISEVYGQKQAKDLIRNGLEKGSLPNNLVFYGASGTGKTTCARIVAIGLSCEKGMTSTPCCECDSCYGVISGRGIFALNEYNAAYFTGIDHMRGVVSMFNTPPIGFDRQVIIFDECHRLSKEAQTLLLKVIEDGIPGSYFILCSTDSEKILEPLLNRCLPVEFKELSNEEIWKLLVDVCWLENIEYHVETLEDIVAKSGGKPRNALYLLQKAFMTLTQPKLAQSAAA